MPGWCDPPPAPLHRLLKCPQGAACADWTSNSWAGLAQMQYCRPASWRVGRRNCNSVPSQQAVAAPVLEPSEDDRPGLSSVLALMVHADGCAAGSPAPSGEPQVRAARPTLVFACTGDGNRRGSACVRDKRRLKEPAASHCSRPSSTILHLNFRSRLWGFGGKVSWEEATGPSEGGCGLSPSWAQAQRPLHPIAAWKAASSNQHASIQIEGSFSYVERCVGCRAGCLVACKWEQTGGTGCCQPLLRLTCILSPGLPGYSRSVFLKLLTIQSRYGRPAIGSFKREL